MTLALEIEFLAGVCFAATGPDSPVPDWPPQPDRVYSALVATWAAHGQDQSGKHALEWLEALPPPRVVASAAEPRTVPTVFVPPNDPRSDRQKHAPGVLPQLRGRQPRRFPAVRPHDPTVHLVWREQSASDVTFNALQDLARDTAYIGHSSSLTRCRFRQDEAISILPGEPARRRVYRGRLAELQRVYPTARPSPGTIVRPDTGPETPPRLNPFGTAWLLLEHSDGDMPDIRAAALVARTIRATVMSGYAGQPIPPAVSGHEMDGRPTPAHHLAIVPLAFAGFPFADGHVVGFALVPPGDCELFDDLGFRAALRNVAPMRDDRRVMSVRAGPPAPFAIDLTLTGQASRRSLDPSLYLGPARRFATVTPIVLDRHLKQSGAAQHEEICALIARACCRIGLPEPCKIRPDKHPAIEGVPSASPSGSSPAWMRWRLPPSLGSRQLTHAVIEFAAPVDGPVILGAGRFLGLGLCKPIAT